jgi:hypothetical protein
MPFKDRLSKLGNKIKPNSERNRYTWPDEPQRSLPRTYPSPQTPPNVQVPFNAQPIPVRHPMNNHAPGLVSTSTISTGQQMAVTPPYSPQEYYSPQDIGRPSWMAQDGVQVLELDGNRQPDTEDGQRTAYREERERQTLAKYHQDSVERARQEDFRHNDEEQKSPTGDRRLTSHWENQTRQTLDEYNNRSLEKAKEESLRKREEEREEEERKKRLEMQRDASRESVRKVRRLIRNRYRLDLYVWNMRDVLKANRPLILKSCEKSDRILQHIYFIVNSWEREAFDEREWEVARTIKDILSHTERHAVWGDQPPWGRDDAFSNDSP